MQESNIKLRKNAEENEGKIKDLTSKVKYLEELRSKEIRNTTSKSDKLWHQLAESNSALSKLTREKESLESTLELSSLVSEIAQVNAFDTEKERHHNAMCNPKKILHLRFQF